MEEYLKYWDEVLDYWVKKGEVHPSEAYWFDQKIGLYPQLMPEPYMGNPNESSLVIMNYNPGAAKYDLETETGREAYQKDAVHHSRLDDSESMCHDYARNYREKMVTEGYVARDVNPNYHTSKLTKGGKDWWNKRLDWFKELVPESKKAPFAIELCGWHSNEWTAVKYTRELLGKLNNNLANVIEEAIQASELGIGLCVGAQWGTTILPAFGYKDVTAEIMGLSDYHNSWKPIDEARGYRILRNDKGVYIINTWKSGFRNMDVPKPEFRPIEKEIIQRIQHTKQG